MKHKKPGQVQKIFGMTIKPNSNLYRVLCDLPPIAKSLKDPTAMQIAYRQKFGFVNKLASKFSEAVKVGFFCKRFTRAGVNILCQQIYRDAIAGEFPNYQVNYSKFILSTGVLDKVDLIPFNLSSTGLLDLGWNLQHIREDCYPTDHLFISIYNATKDQANHFPKAGQRIDKKSELQIPDYIIGDEIHLWYFMVTENGRQASNSSYLKIA